MAVQWCKKHPGRLRHELRTLREIGPRFSIDVDDLKRGLVTITGDVTVDGENIELIIKYPDSYPYFRCEFIAPGLDLPHHQNPFLKNLCLISRSTANWYISDTASSLIKEQLPKTLYAGRADKKELEEGIETEQGEPITQCINTFMPGSCVLFDSAWKIDPDVDNGTLILGISRAGGIISDQWIILEVRDKSGNILAKASEEMYTFCSSTIRGKWTRLEDDFKSYNPVDLFNYIVGKDPIAKNLNDLYGLLLKEESSWRGTGDGWLFLKRMTKKEARSLQLNHKVPMLIRGMRAGRTDITARTPELAPLSNKKILIAGLGCLGGPSALEFAKCGIKELRLLDNDHVEAGTTTRWPFGINAAGIFKSYYLASFIKQNYPFTKVVPIVHRFGAVRHMDGPPPPENKSDLQLIEEALEGIDLIYDATAEIGVQRFLSDIAYDKGIPYVKVSATPGLWGGEVARILPGKTNGCWLCLYQSQEDGSINIPHENLSGTLYPAGCGDITFTGASFDSNIIAMTGVRLVISTLLGSDNGYPDLDWDVAIINLRDNKGSLISPQFNTYSLKAYDKCPSNRH